MAERGSPRLKILPRKHEAIRFTLCDSEDGEMVSEILIRNVGEEKYACFKVKTNAAEQYWVVPKCGFIRPGGSCTVRLQMRPKRVKTLLSEFADSSDAATALKDRFLLQTFLLLESEVAEAEAVLSSREKAQLSDGESGTDLEADEAVIVNKLLGNTTKKDVMNTKRSVEVILKSESVGAAEGDDASMSKVSEPSGDVNSRNTDVSSVENPETVQVQPLVMPENPNHVSAEEVSYAQEELLQLRKSEAEKASTISGLNKELQKLRESLKSAQLNEKRLDKQLAESVKAHREARKIINSLKKEVQEAQAGPSRSVPPRGKNAKPDREARSRKKLPPHAWDANPTNSMVPMILRSYPIGVFPQPLNYFALMLILVVSIDLMSSLAA